MKTTKKVVDSSLLGLLLEELKLPLLHIARQSEIALAVDVSNYEDINKIAEMAIRLIDSYSLSVRLANKDDLSLEPVSISSVLYSAADNLASFAKLYNCQIEVHVAGKYAPVMSQRLILESAFTMLGHSLIEANQPDLTTDKLVLSTYKTSRGLSAGIFSSQFSLDASGYKRGLANLGKSKQALPNLTQSSGAGVFIADALLANLATKLRVARYKKISGLAATMLPSHQLSII